MLHNIQLWDVEPTLLYSKWLESLPRFGENQGNGTYVVDFVILGSYVPYWISICSGLNTSLARPSSLETCCSPLFAGADKDAN